MERHTIVTRDDPRYLRHLELTQAEGILLDVRLVENKLRELIRMFPDTESIQRWVDRWRRVGIGEGRYGNRDITFVRVNPHYVAIRSMDNPDETDQMTDPGLYGLRM